MALRVLDQLFPRHAPLPRRRNDLEIGREGSYTHVEPDLVVTLAGAAVSNCLCPLLAGGVHQQPGYQRAGERGGESVLSLIYRVRLEGREHEIADESLLRVQDQRLDGSNLQRLLANRLVLSFRTYVYAQGDDIHAVPLGDPLDRHRGIDSTAVGQYYFVLQSGSSEAPAEASSLRQPSCLGTLVEVA